MKVWERRLMKDFQVTPVEVGENENSNEAPQASEENPLDRFRRIGKQVASQSTTVKWSEVIRSATVEANSQIGRCRNRESFKNQQNLFKAMEQAKRLIDRSPLPQSPAHSDTYSVVNQTNETLIQLLKNISEEINEMSPGNTLNVKKLNSRSVTPLQSLNVQLQSMINSRNPSPYATKEKPRSSSPRPVVLNLKKPEDRVLSPPPKPLPDTTTPRSQTPKSPSNSRPQTPKSPKSPTSKFELSKSPLSRPPTSILKNRSQAPDSCKSIEDDSKVVTTENKPIMSMPSIEISAESDIQSHTSSCTGEEKPQSPTLIDLHGVDGDNQKASIQEVPGSPYKVAKRKAPSLPSINNDDQSSQDISISRPIAVKVTSNHGMIPPPPSKSEEIKAPVQIPILSTTPATPLTTQKQFSSPQHESQTVTPTPSISPPPIKPHAPEPPTMTAIAVDACQSYSSTESLVKSKDPSAEANKAASSPPCLRPVHKIEDVKTIKRQMKTGWL